MIAFFLWITVRLTRRAGNMATVVCAAAALAFPICTVSMYNFLPDQMCGLMAAFCILETIRHPLVRAPWRYQLLLGVGWAMALMLKPSVSPATMLFLWSSVGLAVVRDLNLAPRRQFARAIKAGAVVIGVAAGLSGAAYFSLALGQHLSRWHVGRYILRTYVAVRRLHAPAHPVLCDETAGLTCLAHTSILSGRF